MNTFKLDNKDQAKALKWVQLAASKDQAREILTGIYIDNGSTVTADGFRMHIIPTPEPIRDSISMQDKVIKPVSTITINPTIQEYEVIEGRFPQWEEIVPSKEPIFRIRLNPKYLAALKDIPTDETDSILLEFTDSNHPVKITGAEGCIAVIMPMKKS